MWSYPGALMGICFDLPLNLFKIYTYFIFRDSNDLYLVGITIDKWKLLSIVFKTMSSFWHVAPRPHVGLVDYPQFHSSFSRTCAVNSKDVLSQSELGYNESQIKHQYLKTKKFCFYMAGQWTVSLWEISWQLGTCAKKFSRF